MASRTLKRNDIVMDLRRANRECNGELSQQKYAEIGDHSYSTVAREFGSWNKGKVAAGIKEINKNIRTRSANHDYFEVIDEKTAYILGFLVADGCVYNNGTIQGISQDKDILQKILEVMEADYKLSKTELPKKYERPIYYFQIKSDKMAGDLAKYGVVPRKTDKIILPDLDKDNMRHFIRGFFDGDGTVYQRSDGNQSIVTAFSSISYDFIYDLKDFLEEEYSIEGGISRNEDTTKALEVQYAKKASIGLYDLMYRDATIYGERKKQKFDEIINTVVRKYYGDFLADRILVS